MGEAAEYEEKLNAGWYDEPPEMMEREPGSYVRRCVGCLGWFRSNSAVRMVCSPACEVTYNRERKRQYRRINELPFEIPLPRNMQ